MGDASITSGMWKGPSVGLCAVKAFQDYPE